MEVRAKRKYDQIDELESIKTNVRRAYDYFQPNYDRYNEFREFIFKSSLKSEEITLLTDLGKPQLEFNILEAYISRLLGEFSKQEPDIEVRADDHAKSDPATIQLVEEHLRHALCDAENSHTRYEIYKQILSGGFSSLKVRTEYSHPMSFDQVIKIDACFDPTMTGYDQTARLSHKGDGRFCFELYPMSKEDFECEYPDVDISQLSFRRDFEGFNWSYVNDSTEMLILADYYKKIKKEVSIVKLVNGEVITEKEYKKMLKTWSSFEAPPAIVDRPRKTIMESIDRYIIVENKILKHEETDYKYLPLIFVDGNSALIKTPKNGNIIQFTRPYVYHAKGAQRLKNYAGIALANEIENVVQHKFIIKKEALPKEEEFLEAIKDITKPNNVVVNAFYENNPDQPIPEPIREIVKVPAPPEALQAFTGSDSLIQNILGSYDASLGINDNQLSGVAIVEAASQSNATAMPYIVGYLQGFQRAAQLYVDLMPKYFTTARTLPVMGKDGKKSYIRINDEQNQNSMDMNFDTNSLNVVVKAGASFQVQKSRTIAMVKEMMGMSPVFAQFIAEKGLNFVLDNMEGKGVDQLKEMVDEFVQELQQQKQMMMQQQQQEMQNNPQTIKNQLSMQKMQQDQVKADKQFQLEIANLQAKQEELQASLIKERERNSVQMYKADTERKVHHDNMVMKHNEMSHKHMKETTETSIKHRDMHNKHKQAMHKGASR